MKKKRKFVTKWIIYFILFFICNYNLHGQNDNSKLIWKGNGPSVPLSVSSDGHLYVTTSGNPGILTLRDVIKDTILHLEKPNEGMPEFCVISPDNKKIAYDWLPWRKGDIVFQLRILDISNNSPKILHDDPYWSWIRPLDWSNNGESILAERWQRGDNLSHWVKGQLIVINSVNKNITVLDDNLNGGIGEAKFSPDGKFVFYDQPKSLNVLKHDIFKIDVQTKVISPFINLKGDEMLFGFTTDGNSIIFWTNSYGIEEVVMQEIDKINIKPIGEHEILYSGLAISGGNIKDSQFISSIQVDHSRLFVSPVNIDEKFDLRSIAEIKLPKKYSGIQYADWSYDNNFIAIIARRTIPLVGGLMHEIQDVINPDRVLLIYDFKNSTIKELKLSNNVQPFSSPRWTFDGKSVFLIGQSSRQPKMIYNVNIDTGESKSIIKSGLYHGRREEMDISSDGVFIYYLRDKGQFPPSIEVVRHDIASGEELVLHTIKKFGNFSQLALSNDGDKLAIATIGWPSKVIVLSTKVANDIKVYKAKANGWMVSVSWTPDHSSLIFTLQESWMVNHSLWILDLYTEEIKSLENFGDRIVRPNPWSGSPRFSKNGDKLLFIAGTPKYEVRSIDLNINE